MPRKTAPKKDDEFHFSSQGSDDHMLQQALAERVLAAKEKKKKETEKKFLASASNHLAKSTTEVSEQLEAIYQIANDEYQKFVMTYASVDDEIRALWVVLEEEFQTIQKLAERRAKINAVSGQSCEAAHIKAISKVRAACIETQNVIDTMNSN